MLFELNVEKHLHSVNIWRTLLLAKGKNYAQARKTVQTGAREKGGCPLPVRAMTGR